jgi:hypothetical protein
MLPFQIPSFYEHVHRAANRAGISIDLIDINHHFDRTLEWSENETIFSQQFGLSFDAKPISKAEKKISDLAREYTAHETRRKSAEKQKGTVQNIYRTDTGTVIITKGKNGLKVHVKKP